MKKTTQILLSISLVLGFVPVSYAAKMNQEFVSDSNQRLQHYQSMISAETALKYGEILLVRSTVAKKLKLSDNPSERMQYADANSIYKKAQKAYQNGNDVDAKKLAIKAIRIIAHTVPKHYSRIAKLNK